MQGRLAGTTLLVLAGLIVPAGALGAEKPNLKVTQVTNSPEVIEGSSFEVSDTTSNRGSKRSKRSTTRYYLSANTAKDNTDLLLDGSHRVPRLKPKKSHEASGNPLVPAEAIPATYYLIACADDNRVVSEKKENDNCRTSAEQVEVVPVPDTDADGVPDEDDNCVEVANPGQSDADADSKGDSCDPCPSDSNPGSQGCPTTVYLINMGTTPSGSTVRLSNVVVQGVDTTGAQHTWIAEPQGSPNFTGYLNSGLEMTRPAVPTPPSVGDNITVDGTLATVSGRPLLTPTAITVNSTGNAPNPPYAVTADAVAAATTNLHGVLVQVSDVTVASVTGGDWTINGGAIVDDEIFALPETTNGAGYSTITGIARSSSAGTLAPRFSADIVPVN